MTRQRLQKLIAAAGLCSRRRGEEWLQDGRVTVDGRVATLGDQADPDHQLIEVDGVPLTSTQEPRVLLLNKPVGVICSCRDPQGRATVLDCLPPQERPGLHPVGRLDADSRGALLLTDQGELTLKLTHPRYSHAKTYRVLVRGIPSSKASSVSLTPSFSEFCQTPVSKIAKAVSEQTTTVSMKGPNMAIKPSRIGSLVLD